MSTEYDDDVLVKGFGLSLSKKRVFRINKSFRHYMDVKQEVNPKAFIFTLPNTKAFFIAALSQASEKLTIRVILVQEVLR